MTGIGIILPTIDILSVQKLNKHQKNWAIAFKTDFERFLTNKL